MQYIVVTIQTAADDTVISVAHNYSTFAEAQSAYFSELSSAVISKALLKDVCMIVDSKGNTYGNTTVNGLASNEAMTDTGTE